MKRQLIAILAGLIAASGSFLAHAAWPERPLTFVVPVAAGGLADHSARITAQWLSKSLKQNVIVENRLGGNLSIGVDYVARARPDGYTLLFTPLPGLVMVPHTQKVPYDTFKSFEPISMMDASYMAFAVNPSQVPVKNFSELVAYAKARPNQLNFATGAIGGTGHLSMELLLKRAGITMTHVPYKGNSEALLAVLSGQVPVYSGTLSDVLSYQKSGKLRILGITSAKRVSEAPDVPTIAEQGFPGYEVLTWNGLLAPAGTPKAVIAKISASLKAACHDAAFNAAYAALGVKAVCSTPGQFEKRLRSDWTMWGDAVKTLGTTLK